MRIDAVCGNPGQPAEVKVDAMPNVVPAGQVEIFVPGTGSEIALLPFESGTGNFTKIAESVSVHIRLNTDQAAPPARLWPGLSVTAGVRVTERRAPHG
jgi:membrane fusion protein (multidrug efflux system)